MTNRRDDRSRERRALLQQWLNRRSTADFPTLVDELRDAQRLFLQECAARLGPSLQQHAITAPHDTFESKSILCRRISEVLASLHLGLLCERSGDVGILVADRSGGDPVRGRFRISATDADGRRYVGQSSVDLPSLVLVVREARLNDQRRTPRQR